MNKKKYDEYNSIIYNIVIKSKICKIICKLSFLFFSFIIFTIFLIYIFSFNIFFVYFHFNSNVIIIKII